MHPYWTQAISNDRIESLRRQADRRRVAAVAVCDSTEPLSTRLHQRLAALLVLVAPIGPQPQPCAC